jgi:hypothetical protein
MPECKCAYYELHDEHWSHSYSGVTFKTEVTPPWAESIKCAITNDDKAFKAYWPHFSQLHKCCITALVADYYVYELIKFQSSYKKMEGNELFEHFLSAGFKPNSNYFVGKLAEIKIENLVKQWAAPLKEYLHYAAVAELTHCEPFVKTFGQDPACAYWGWGLLAKNVGKIKAAEYAESLFSQPWPTAFGGPRWKKITSVLKYGEQGHVDGHAMSDHLFLDRVFSLQHNTGVVFSKFSKWNMKRYNTNHAVNNPHSISKLHKVLDAHHSGDIETLLIHASPTASKLYKKLTQGN